MIHQPQKNLLLVVNIVRQVKHRVVVNLQALLFVLPVVNLVVVNQAHLAALLVQVQVHLLVAVLQAQVVVNQVAPVPQAVQTHQVAPALLPVHLIRAAALQVVVNLLVVQALPVVHPLVVPHLVVLPQVVRPVVLLQAVPLANLVPQAVVHQVRCQLTQLNQSTRDVHIKTSTLTTYITPPLLHLRVPLKY